MPGAQLGGGDVSPSPAGGASSPKDGTKGGTKGPGSPPSRGTVTLPKVSTALVGDTITVGLHVPVTGAAPLPTNWDDALSVVQQYINATGIHGRKVRFIVEDDGYDPAKGLAACRKLADEKVLFVIGHTMPTIEDSCAGFFGKRGIPYLMRGVPESTLKGRPLAWFGTPSDDRQARMLADYVLTRMGGKTKTVGVVTENDQPVSKTVFVDRIKAGGGTVGAVENSVPRQPDFGPIVEKLKGSGAQIVFLNIAPVDAIKIAVQAQGSGYHPTWIGEGTHWNYNLALEAAGKALDGAIVFSPWSSVDSAAANSYKAAFAKYAPNAQADDIGLIIWGWAMLARQALLDSGAQLSRTSLVKALSTFEFDEPYWNPVTYTASDHRGPTQVAVFRGDGQAKRWRQIEGFRSSF